MAHRPQALLDRERRSMPTLRDSQKGVAQVGPSYLGMDAPAANDIHNGSVVLEHLVASASEALKQDCGRSASALPGVAHEGGR